VIKLDIAVAAMQGLLSQDTGQERYLSREYTAVEAWNVADVFVAEGVKRGEIRDDAGLLVPLMPAKEE